MSQREQLEDILSGSEYEAYRNQGGGFSFWDWLLEKIGRFLSWLLPDLKPGEGTLNIFALVLVLALAGLLAWIGVLIARRYSGGGRLRSRDYMASGEESRSWRHYWAQAEKHAELGAWRDGVRAVFLALLFYLEQRDRLRVEPWKTNREYAEELAESNAGTAAGFLQAAMTFERSWYGRGEVTGEQLEAFRRQAESLMKEAGDPEP
ncbi:DUF4129 domain-containing protein [Paenibacillus humicus]|uniref:DUF4129 domain-containing protein n=1 Tax=Paenibacillus humicus TaxID=412861 RepID=UPI000FD93D07|nr:DUF4129 domain-containing protein [Paenibacillus humicus]